MIDESLMNRDVVVESCCQALAWVAAADDEVNEKERAYLERFLAGAETDLEICRKLFEGEIKEVDRDCIRPGLSLRLALTNVHKHEKLILALEEMAAVDGPINQAERIIISGIKELMGVPDEVPEKMSFEGFVSNFDFREFVLAKEAFDEHVVNIQENDFEEILRQMNRLFDVTGASYNYGRKFAKEVTVHLAKAGYLPAQKRLKGVENVKGGRD